MTVAAKFGPAGPASSALRPSADAWLPHLAILLVALAYFGIEMAMPMNHDVAWLMDAGSRWMAGERLYVDLIEVNPPLIFWVYAILTAGTFAKPVLIGAVIALMVASSMWTARLAGWRAGFAALAASIACGVMDFGQRDHLAAIVAFPYLFADRAGRGERIAIGAFAFVGFGLKPFLALIPIGATIGRMTLARDWRPAFSPENLAMLVLGLGYIAATAALYPEFFTSMIPLGQLVYFAYGAGFAGEPVTIPLLAFSSIVAVVALFRPAMWPLAGALLGGIASYLIQGRFWTYHLVPTIALSLFLALQVMRPVGRRGFAARIIAVLCLAILLMQGFRRHYQDLIPPNAKAVLFLSPHVGSAYPAVVDRKVRHASHYPAMWTLPGAWRLLHDPAASEATKQRARAVLNQSRRTIVDDIVRFCPDPIFADIRPRKPYFGAPFDFIQFLEGDPRFTGYVAGETNGMFRYYRRAEPCPPPSA